MSDEICDDMFESTWIAWWSGTHIILYSKAPDRVNMNMCN
jgi:hypothetical protein